MGSFSIWYFIQSGALREDLSTCRQRRFTSLCVVPINASSMGGEEIRQMSRREAANDLSTRTYIAGILAMNNQSCLIRTK